MGFIGLVMPVEAKGTMVARVRTKRLMCIEYDVVIVTKREVRFQILYSQWNNCD